MSTEQTLERLQRFLLILAGSICLGTIIELWLTDHMGSRIQCLPFVLCGAGFLTVMADIIMDAFRAANPLLAPGILSVTSLLTLASIYQRRL